jgi:hypothetical protein
MLRRGDETTMTTIGPGRGDHDVAGADAVKRYPTHGSVAM